MDRWMQVRTSCLYLHRKRLPNILTTHTVPRVEALDCSQLPKITRVKSSSCVDHCHHSAILER